MISNCGFFGGPRSPVKHSVFAFRELCVFSSFRKSLVNYSVKASFFLFYTISARKKQFRLVIFWSKKRLEKRERQKTQKGSKRSPKKGPKQTLGTLSASPFFRILLFSKIRTACRREHDFRPPRGRKRITFWLAGGPKRGCENTSTERSGKTPQNAL
jgi:hypothetical protein